MLKERHLGCYTNMWVLSVIPDLMSDNIGVLEERILIITVQF